MESAFKNSGNPAEDIFDYFYIKSFLSALYIDKTAITWEASIFCLLIGQKNIRFIVLFL